MAPCLKLCFCYCEYSSLCSFGRGCYLSFFFPRQWWCFVVVFLFLLFLLDGDGVLWLSVHLVSLFMIWGRGWCHASRSSYVPGFSRQLNHSLAEGKSTYNDVSFEIKFWTIQELLESLSAQFWKWKLWPILSFFIRWHLLSYSWSQHAPNFERSGALLIGNSRYVSTCLFCQSKWIMLTSEVFPCRSFKY